MHQSMGRYIQESRLLLMIQNNKVPDVYDQQGQNLLKENTSSR